MGRDTLTYLIINEYEYQVLTDTWDGPPGAAYNAAWEYCHENGLILGNGTVTSKGQEQIDWMNEIMLDITRQ